MKPVMATVRDLEIRLIIYLDDLHIILGRLRTDCPLATALNLLDSLGFVNNLKRSVLSSVQKIELLGMSVDAVTLCLALSWDKVRSIRKECRGLIIKPSYSSAAISTSLRSFELLHSSSFPCPTVLPLPTTGKDPSPPIMRPLLVSGTSEQGSSFAIKFLQKEKQTFKYIQLLMDNVTALISLSCVRSETHNMQLVFRPGGLVPYIGYIGMSSAKGYFISHFGLK